MPDDDVQQERWREQVRLPIEIEQQLDRQRRVAIARIELPDLELEDGLGIDL